MIWEKRGWVFVPGGDQWWAQTHAQVPFALPVEGGRIRVYFGARDKNNQTHTGYLEVEENDPGKVVFLNPDPVMDLGKPGCFDSNGVMPASLVRNGDGRIFLYYTGWNRGGDVPFRVAIGRAVSLDGGVTFEREFEGPIVDRSIHEPVAASQPCVIQESQDSWRMYYLSYTHWESVRGSLEPCYRLKVVHSSDGLNWEFPGNVCIDYDERSDAISTPSVWKDSSGVYHMLFSYRKSDGYRETKHASYRMGYAQSADGLQWKRDDSQSGVERAETGWDSEMVAYPNVFESGGRTYLYYNGNGFGASGFGLAELVQQ